MLYNLSWVLSQLGYDQRAVLISGDTDCSRTLVAKNKFVVRAPPKFWQERRGYFAWRPYTRRGRQWGVFYRYYHPTRPRERDPLYRSRRGWASLWTSRQQGRSLVVMREKPQAEQKCSLLDMEGEECYYIKPVAEVLLNNPREKGSLYLRWYLKINSRPPFKAVARKRRLVLRSGEEAKKVKV